MSSLWKCLRWVWLSGNGNAARVFLILNNLNQLSSGRSLFSQVAAGEHLELVRRARGTNHVSLTAEPGKVTALIGSNGSGKTTLPNGDPRVILTR